MDAHCGRSPGTRTECSTRTSHVGKRPPRERSFRTSSASDTASNSAPESCSSRRTPPCVDKASTFDAWCNVSKRARTTRPISSPSSNSTPSCAILRSAVPRATYLPSTPACTQLKNQTPVRFYPIEKGKHQNRPPRPTATR